MKYKVDVTINGYLEIEAESGQEAKDHAEDGYSMSDVVVEDDDIGEVSISLANQGGENEAQTKT